MDRSLHLRPRAATLVAAAVVSALALVLGMLSTAAPAAAGSGSPWLSYAGKSISMAKIPAAAVVISAHSPWRMDSVVLTVGSHRVGSSGAFSPSSAGFTADVQADLTGLDGGMVLTARYTAGTKHWSIRKTIRAVTAPSGATPAPGAAGAPAVLAPPAVPSSTPAPGGADTPATGTDPAPPTEPAVVPDGATGATATGSPSPAAEATPGSGGDVVLSQPRVDLTLFGRPGPDNTGVPAGQVLRPSGSLWLTTPGQVVSNLDVNGCVVVLASNITLRNVRITCGNPRLDRVIEVGRGVENLLVEDSEINGLGTADIGVGWSNYTLRRVEIRGTCDGARTAANVLVEDSWIHDLRRQGTLHCDAVQSTEGRNITVRGSVLDPTTLQTGDLNNAAVMLGTETGTRQLTGALFENNWMGGGNYSVNVRGDATLTDVRFVGNVYTGGARYGPSLSPPGATFQGNVTMEGAPWVVIAAR